jgi:hypothetical protein
MFDGGYVVDGAYTCDFSQPASTYNGLTPFTITNTFLFTYNAVPGRAFTIDLGDVLRK